MSTRRTPNPTGPTTDTGSPAVAPAATPARGIENNRPTAQCRPCGEVFTGPAAFDAHRHNGHCLNPAAAGLVDAGRDYPCWAIPSPPPQEKS